MTVCCSDHEAHLLLKALRHRGAGHALFASLATSPKETLRAFADMSDKELAATSKQHDRNAFLAGRLARWAQEA